MGALAGRLSLAILTALMAASVAVAAPSQNACKLPQIAELPVTMAGGVPLVPVKFDSKPALMLVGIGSARSLMQTWAANRLNLQSRPSNATLYGPSGRVASRSVGSRLTLGGSTASRVFFIADGTLPGNAAGVLGEDFLSQYDIEFDLPEGKIRLFDPTGCKTDGVVYWSASYSMIQLVRPRHDTHWVEGEVEVDGHKMLAMFDSGATFSTIGSEAVHYYKIKSEIPLVNGEAARGLNQNRMESQVAIFDTLKVGQEVIRNASVRITDLSGKQFESGLAALIDISPIEADIVIGADFLLAHRVYFARRQSKLYFTYNGQPIFRPAPAAQPTESTKDTPAGDGAATH